MNNHTNTMTKTNKFTAVAPPMFRWSWHVGRRWGHRCRHAATSQSRSACTQHTVTYSNQT